MARGRVSVGWRAVSMTPMQSLDTHASGAGGWGVGGTRVPVHPLPVHDCSTSNHSRLLAIPLQSRLCGNPSTRCKDLLSIITSDQRICIVVGGDSRHRMHAWTRACERTATSCLATTQPRSPLTRAPVCAHTRAPANNRTVTHTQSNTQRSHAQTHTHTRTHAHTSRVRAPLGHALRPQATAHAVPATPLCTTWS